MIRDERRHNGGEGGFTSAYKPIIAAMTLFVFGVAALAVEPGARAQSQTFNAPQGRVENVSFEQIAGGVINIYYDLISTSPDGVFSITVKASSDGGNSFNLQPSAITGDVTDVKPGARRKIVWRSGQDVAVLAFDQLKFDVVATAGTTQRNEAPAGAAPPAGGGSKMKFILPIAGGGAAAAFFLLKGKGGDDGGGAAPCTSFSISPSSVDFPAGGSSTTITVTGTPAGCTGPWTASTGSSFITVSPSSGSGNGQVTLTAAANGTPIARNGTVTIASQTVTFTQGSGPSCLTVASIPTVPFEGGTRGPITVTAAGCTPTNTWSVAATVNPGGFISGITPATSSGNGSFTFQAAPNSSTSARTGAITVSNPSSGTPVSQVQLTFTQNAFSCVYSVTRSPAGNIPAAGNTAVTVQLTNAQNCAWKGTFNPNPSNAPSAGNMLRFNNMSTDGITATGTGTTTLMITVAPLPTGTTTRTGTVVITDTVTNTTVASATIIQP